MIVSNPDFNRPGSGDPMPGRIGSMYADLGGRVEYIGKPYPAVYQKCFESFDKLHGGSTVKGRTCGVGDSLDHDILGANNFGIASVFTANGVHCGQLGTTEGSGETPNLVDLENLLLKLNVQPNFIIPNFSW